MDSGASKERKSMNELGEVITKVDTVDHQTLPGQGQQKRDVQVIHKSHPSGNSTTVTGVVADAATAAIQAAKDAMAGK